MPITIENLTNPGQPPADGDKLRITSLNGNSVVKSYYTPIEIPDPPRLIPRREFLSRFTDDEISLIWRLSETNQRIHGWTIWVSSQDEIDLDMPRITQILQAGVSAGKITQDRVDEILA